MVLVESMRFGVVPLAYPVDGAAFILKDHPDLLVSPRDPAIFGHKLRALACSDQRADLGEAMKAVIERRFSEDAIAGRWSTLFALS